MAVRQEEQEVMSESINEIREPELDTPEEREKFHQEVCIAVLQSSINSLFTRSKSELLSIKELLPKTKRTDESLSVRGYDDYYWPIIYLNGKQLVISNPLSLRNLS